MSRALIVVGLLAINAFRTKRPESLKNPAPLLRLQYRVTLMAENICLLRYPSMPLLTFLTGGQNLKANNPFDEGI